MAETTAAPFAVIERNDLVPRCPHCHAELPEVYARARGVPIGQGRTLMYFCPYCLEVLGFAQGRMI